MGLATKESLRDGSLRGVTGPMAKVSWGDLPLITTISGSGATAAARTESQDGGVGYYALSCGAAGLPNGASLTTVVLTSGAGIRVQRLSAAAQPPVDMIVDGRCVEAFRTTQPTVNGVVAGTWTDNEASFLWPYALKPIQHTISARVDANPDGTTTNFARFSGFLLPRADGFRDTTATPRKGYLGNATLLASTTAVTFAGVTYDQATAAVHLVNTDTTAAHTATIYREDGTTIYDTVTVPQATSAALPGVKLYQFPSPRNLSSWKVKPDAANFLTIWSENV